MLLFRRGVCLAIHGIALAECLVEDEKECFTRFGRDFRHDYSVTFADNQRVQKIRERLLRTIVILDANVEVANGCELHCIALDDRNIGVPGQHLVSELQAYSAELRSHRWIVGALLERSQGTLSLVS